ncbi:glycosyltransferase family 61 protein [Yoonia sp. GPGPB17]
MIKKWTIQSRSRRPDCLELDRVLLVRHVFGHIYFHTYHDLMSKIVWADELGIDPEIPIVVDAKWARGHYGKHFVTTTLMSGRKVYFHEWDQTLRCNELYWLKPPQFHRPHLDAVANSFEEHKPDNPPGPHIVLTREKKTHDDRFCEDMNVLRAHLTDKGYFAIDPADFTIPEQKWIFSRAEHVVAENGSALTNAIFRRNPTLRIDAIIGAGAATTTFQALSSVYGFDIRSHIVESVREGKVTRIVLDRETAKRISDAA